MENKMAYIENMGMEMAIILLDMRMTTMEVAVSTIGSAQMSRNEKIEEKNKFWKEVLESKAISNIGKLSTPSEYRMWSKKFKNAYEQVRLYARKMLQWLDTVKERDILAELEVGAANMIAMEAIMEHFNMEVAKDMKIGGGKYEGMRENLIELNRDLWSILLDKCEGEAWMKINSVRDGEGLWAYIKLHQWFTKTTLQGQTNNRLRIMQPIAPKHDHEVAGAVERWEERYRMLLEEDGEDELPEKYKMSALKQLLCGDIRKHIDLKEQELRTYAEMRSAIMTWAVNKRLEKERESGVQDMDCGHIAGGAKSDPAHGGGQAEVYWPEDAGWMQGDVNYIKGGGGNGYGKSLGGKGYGKSLGGKGGDKGKGKGTFQGSCWICGQEGHSARFCPKGGYKGGEKGGKYGG